MRGWGFTNSMGTTYNFYKVWSGAPEGHFGRYFLIRDANNLVFFTLVCNLSMTVQNRSLYFAKDVVRHPRVGVGLARLRPLAAYGVGCPAEGQNLESGQLSRHFKAAILLNMTLNHNKPTNQICSRHLLCVSGYLKMSLSLFYCQHRFVSCVSINIPLWVAHSYLTSFFGIMWRKHSIYI